MAQVKIRYEYQALQETNKGNFTFFDWRAETKVEWVEGSEECNEQELNKRLAILSKIVSEHGGKQYRNIKWERINDNTNN